MEQTNRQALGSQRGTLALPGGVRKINRELVAFGQVVKYLGKTTALVKESKWSDEVKLGKK